MLGVSQALGSVINALREAGLESSNLILGIDFTKSNEWTGRHSFNRKSLHAITSTPNPYEQAISIIGRTLSPFDEDNLIPCFGFGDASTHDKFVFSFYSDQRDCHGFEEVLARYREIVPYLNLSGPTSFAPIIDAAVDIVEQRNGQYHVLVIIADGQVTAHPGRFNPQEQATINSVVAASHYPLSIILVGVGDGPWDAMRQFDDNIPQRAFDNFQFVNFTKIMSENPEPFKKETAFALAALMEIPIQYRATQSLQFDYRDRAGGPRIKPLPPPPEVMEHDNSVKSFSHMTESDTSEPAAPLEQVLVCPDHLILFSEHLILFIILSYAVQGLPNLLDKSKEHGFWLRTSDLQRLWRKYIIMPFVPAANYNKVKTIQLITL
ncbi:Copine, C-terminal [Dillenia turbinata]|uniref:Copine, C-terminal n=1 Tax=Dillenia turbinata TaxID=194707 RepID=A0AAN8V7N6_9MAGN